MESSDSQDAVNYDLQENIELTTEISSEDRIPDSDSYDDYDQHIRDVENNSAGIVSTEDNYDSDSYFSDNEDSVSEAAVFFYFCILIKGFFISTSFEVIFSVQLKAS